jgi:hypothetical protein
MGQMVARSSASILDGGLAAMEHETDLELARGAMPAQLKLIEGLIEEDPGNATLRLYAAQGLYGYAYGFVEDESPARAAALYARCLDHAGHALAHAGVPVPLATSLPDIEAALARVDKNAVPALFWSASCLAKIADMRRDDPSAVAEVPKSVALMKRALELDPAYYHGGPHLFFGAYYGGLSALFGGDPARSREHFAAARTVNPNLRLADLLEAQYLARQNQDRAAFHSLLERARSAPADAPHNLALLNAIAADKARALLVKEAEWF